VKRTVRLNFEFPREEYPYLKMMCADMGVSFKDFATDLLMKEIEDYEDCILAKKAQKRLEKMDRSENISIEDAFESSGWGDEE